MGPHRPTPTFGQQPPPQRYPNYSCTDNDTIEVSMCSRRSRKPSVELPQITRLLKNQSLPRSRIKKFYTEMQDYSVRQVLLSPLRICAATSTRSCGISAATRFATASASPAA